MSVVIRLFGEYRSNTFADFGHLDNRADRGAPIFYKYSSIAKILRTVIWKFASSKYYESGGICCKAGDSLRQEGRVNLAPISPRPRVARSSSSRVL